MRRGRIFILLAMLMLLGVGVVYLLIPKVPPEPPPTPEGAILPSDMVMVVVAGQDISRGSTISSEAGAVVTSDMPRDLVVETMLSGENEEILLSQVVGRVARIDIARGLIITDGMITERKAGALLGEGSDAALSIEPGLTAISIPMNRLSGVAYALQDGDFVDVLITLLMIDLDADFQTILPNETLVLLDSSGIPITSISCERVNITTGLTECIAEGAVPVGKVEGEAVSGQTLYVGPTEVQRPRLVTQRLVELAMVLHVGTFTLEEEVSQEQAAQGEQVGAAAPPPQEGGVPAESPEAPDIITLIMTPQEALSLNWAIKAGADIAFTLRAPGDTGITETTSVTLQYLLESYDISVPTKLPYGLQPSIEVPIVPILPNDPQPPAVEG